MRIDKFLSETGYATRTESKKIAVNGVAIKDTSVHIDPDKDIITFCGEVINYTQFVYIMMNKPDGVISSTDDGNCTTVIELLPERLQKIGLFPCGRLDKNTLGLLILTNNGPLAHNLLSPTKHVEKTYHFRCLNKLSDSDVELLCKGVDIGEKSSTRPAVVNLSSENEGDITVVEGKYHQIKRMFEAIDNKITYLERISFGGINLDITLERGSWRYLTDEETAILENH
ncbi:MAG: rRNA pseudouridine synthase [Clostridia bacterium]|nr:rRNA pseudouridine synthase [Clostridia bacterium]